MRTAHSNNTRYKSLTLPSKALQNNAFLQIKNQTDYTRKNKVNTICLLQFNEWLLNTNISKRLMFRDYGNSLLKLLQFHLIRRLPTCSNIFSIDANHKLYLPFFLHRRFRYHPTEMCQLSSPGVDSLQGTKPVRTSS